MTTFDEEWTEDDMQVHLEWNHERTLTCSGCGFPLSESTAVGRDDVYDAEMVACHACATADRVERAFRERHGDMAGVRRRIWETE